MPRADFFLSVVAPLHDDADIIGDFLKDVTGVLGREYSNYELVLVDDGSTDATAERVSELLGTHECVRLIRLSRSFGQEIAISAGMDSVIGDFVVIMLPDRDPPELIPEIVEMCRSGSGVVFGVRQSRDEDPLRVRIGAKLYYWYAGRVLKVDLEPNSTDFRVFSRQALNGMIRIKDQFRYLRTFSAYVGYGSESFTYEFEHRRSRPRRKTFWESVQTAVSMVIANSTHPLRMLSLTALTLSALSLLYAVYVVLVKLLSENVVPGWATQSLHSSVMFLFVFLILSMMCEYIGRLLAEVKDRPLYYVLEEKTSSVMLSDGERKNVVTQSD